MASFNFDEAALQSLIDKLENNGLFDENTQRELLFAAGDIMKEEAQKGMRAAGLVDTEQTAKHIDYRKKITETRAGGKKIVLTVLGKDKRGERYAVKAFVLNYGRGPTRGLIQKSLFWTRARDRAAPKITRMWEQKITEKLKQKGLI